MFFEKGSNFRNANYFPVALLKSLTSSDAVITIWSQTDMPNSFAAPRISLVMIHFAVEDEFK